MMIRTASPSRIRRATLVRLAPVAALVLAAGCQRVDRDDTPVPLTPNADSAPVTDAAAWTRVANGDPSIDSLFVITRDRGIREGLDSLGALAARDQAAAGRGHELAHALGRFAAAARGDISILVECTPVFQSGCYHGALEGLFAHGATVDASTVDGICTARAGRPGYEALECWHGLGHGLMVRYGGDYRQALPLCDALGSPRGRRECQDGVFMERTIRAIGASSTDEAPAARHQHGAHGGGGHGEHGARKKGGRLSNAELRRLCAEVDARHQPSCWAYQPIALLFVHGDDADAVLTECDAAPAAAARDCYRGFGKQYLGAMGGDAEPMIDACGLRNRAYLADCLLGGVEYFTDLDWSIEPGIAFCARVPAEARARCYDMIGERLALAHPARGEAESACRRIEAPYVAACLAGTRRGQG
ncbi:MAG TPA: hypothetical protein VHG93_28290 [Longimicrobium sp.]|nr:hypothetical protein [Longimicrobium sp.]